MNDKRSTNAQAAFSAGRGLLVIGAALIVGLILLNVVDDPNDDSQRASATTTTSTLRSNPKSTTTTAAPIEKDQIAVLVLNSTSASGVARTISETVAEDGYRTLSPADYDPAQTSTTVWCKDEFDAATRELMDTVGSHAKEGVEPSPRPASFSDASCIVVVGTNDPAATSSNGSASSGSSTSTTSTTTR